MEHLTPPVRSEFSSRLLASLLVLLILGGCGYRLVGRGNALPGHIGKIAVPIFRNRTFEYGIETLMTYAVIDELERRPGIEVVESEYESDAVFRVLLREYEYTPYSDGTGQVVQYRITLRAEIILEDRVLREVFWEDPEYSFTQTYFVSGNLSSYEDNRQDAWEEAAEDFAETVVGSILEGF